MYCAPRCSRRGQGPRHSTLCCAPKLETMTKLTTPWSVMSGRPGQAYRQGKHPVLRTSRFMGRLTAPSHANGLLGTHMALPYHFSLMTVPPCPSSYWFNSAACCAAGAAPGVTTSSSYSSVGRSSPCPLEPSCKLCQHRYNGYSEGDSASREDIPAGNPGWCVGIHKYSTVANCTPAVPLPC